MVNSGKMFETLGLCKLKGNRDLELVETYVLTPCMQIILIGPIFMAADGVILCKM